MRITKKTAVSASSTASTLRTIWSAFGRCVNSAATSTSVSSDDREPQRRARVGVVGSVWFIAPAPRHVPLAVLLERLAGADGEQRRGHRDHRERRDRQLEALEQRVLKAIGERREPEQRDEDHRHVDQQRVGRKPERRVDLDQPEPSESTAATATIAPRAGASSRGWKRKRKPSREP